MQIYFHYFSYCSSWNMRRVWEMNPTEKGQLFHFTLTKFRQARRWTACVGAQVKRAAVVQSVPSPRPHFSASPTQTHYRNGNACCAAKVTLIYASCHGVKRHVIKECRPGNGSNVRFDCSGLICDRTEDTQLSTEVQGTGQHSQIFAMGVLLLD